MQESLASTVTPELEVVSKQCGPKVKTLYFPAQFCSYDFFTLFKLINLNPIQTTEMVFNIYGTANAYQTLYNPYNRMINSFLIANL